MLHGLRRAAGRKPPGYTFDDSGLYKVIEGAAYTLSVHPDPKLRACLDSIETADEYGVERARYNRVRFLPVRTTGLRLELALQPKWSAGVQEWKAG